MMQACTAADVKCAMGNKVGDTLTVGNDWAKITIIKIAPDQFKLVTARSDGDGSVHPNAYRALGRALEILGMYQLGRAG